MKKTIIAIISASLAMIVSAGMATQKNPHKVYIEIDSGTMSSVSATLGGVSITTSNASYPGELMGTLDFIPEQELMTIKATTSGGAPVDGSVDFSNLPVSPTNYQAPGNNYVVYFTESYLNCGIWVTLHSNATTRCINLGSSGYYSINVYNGI